MMNLQIKLLGMPTVSSDGVRLSFPLKKTEGLFYYLLLNKAVSREQIASIFWQDRDENSAANNLRNSIYMLRKMFSHDIILSDKRILTLNPEIVCDMDIDHIADIADPEFTDLQSYSHEFLEGFEILESDSFTSWLRDMRRNVQEIFLEHMRDRVQRCYDSENKIELLNSLSLMVSSDISDDSYVLELMELHASEKRLPKALQIYKDYEKRLNHELNIAPSQRAVDYYAKLSAGALQTQSAGYYENLGEFFFAREAELMAIVRFLQKASNVRGRCVNIHGEPGVGKSTLARQLIFKAEQPHTLVLSGRAYDIGSKYFFSPWYEVMKSLNAKCDLTTLELDPIRLSLLSATFPGTFEKRLPTVNYEITSIFKDASPILLAHTLAEIFRKLAESQGFKETLLLLEDIHWFDEMSMDLLAALLRENDTHLTVITTSRTKPGRAMRNVIENMSLSGSVELLSLELLPFSFEETAGYFEYVLQPSTFKTLNLERIYDKTYGLPLFLAEVASSFRSGGTQKFQDKINNVLAWRYSDITPEEHELLELISIFSSAAPFEVIVSILNADRLKLSKCAELLTARGTIQETEDSEGNLRLSFRHTCLRDFFYDNIAQVRKRELHRLLSERLEKSYNPEIWDPSLSASLCYHLHHAALPVKELDLRLSELRMNVMLNHELFPPLSDEQLKRSKGLLIGKAETMSQLDSLKSILFNLDRKKVTPQQYLKMEATVLELQGGFMIGWGDYSGGLQAVQRSMQIAKANAFLRIHLNCLKHTCYYGIQNEDADILEQQGQEMLFVAKERGDECIQGVAMRFTGVAHQLRGDFKQACDILRESAQHFEQLAFSGHTYTLGALAAWYYIGEMQHWQCDMEEALKTFKNCIAECQTAGLSWGLSLFYSKAGSVAMDMGNVDLAKEYVSKSLTLFEQGEGGRSGSLTYSMRAVLDADAGLYNRALTALQASENLCIPINKRSWMAEHYAAAWHIKKILEEKRNAANASSDKHYAALNSFLSEPSSSYAEKAMAISNAMGMQHLIKRLKKG